MKYFIYGRGFHNGYMCRRENGKRLWRAKSPEIFTSLSDVMNVVNEIPTYIMFVVYDENHNIIYENL